MSNGKIKVIITGGSGLLASNLALLNKDSWQVVFTSTNKASEQKEGFKHLNILNLEDVTSLLNEEKADLVINTAGMTNVEQCEENYYKAFEANALTAKVISQACKKTSTKLVHISTDHFSPDKDAQSDENKIGVPVNNYAKTKLDGEYFVRTHNPDAIIVRTNFYGWGHRYKKSFSDLILEIPESNEKFELFTDVFFTPVHTSTLAKNIISLVEKDYAGVINICGRERLSKYDFGTRLLKFFKKDESLVSMGKLTERENLARRPLDMSLCCNKIIEILGEEAIPTLEEEFQILKDEETRGMREKLYHSPPDKTSKLICYGRQDINESDFESVLETLGSDWLTQGPKVQEFETAISRYVGSKYAVAICNWTCGLHISCIAAGVGPGDAIITSPLSFVASSNSAIYCGATPLFADIDSKTLNIDPESVEKICEKNKNVKALLPVHFGGLSCDMKELKRIADRYDLKIIEDAAHALGGKHQTGHTVGSCSHSDMCGFSFHPVKNITTGEGAVITTNDEATYKELLRLRSHGINKFDDEFSYPEKAFTNGERNYWYHEMQELGFNYRITDLQCSLGLSQLKRIDEFHQRRVDIANYYDKEFSSFQNLQCVQNGTREISGNHLYILKVDFEKIGKNRFEVYREMNEKFNIGLHLHYLPIPLNPYYEQNYKIPESSIQNAIDYYNIAVTLPIYPGLSNSETKNVVKAFKEIVG